MRQVDKSLTIELILEKACKISGITQDGKQFIKKAYFFAEKCHKAQKRLTGEPYIIHPLATAFYLTELKMDAVTIAAGLLHDVTEDSDCSLEEIEKEFGDDVARIVEGVTRLAAVKYFSKKRRIEDLRKLLLIMAEDLRVVIVKLADRLHNMQTLGILPLQKGRRIATETIEVYAPLASRLGMGEMKGLLEDLSFKYYLPKEYKKTVSLIGEDALKRKKYVERVIKELKIKFKKFKIKAEISGRSKHLYSLYKKLKKHNDDFSKIYDLVAIRVIVYSIDDCYKVLGLVHKDWKPLIRRIKDYISIPKPNGYRSIHTTVFCIEGRIIEIQVKTKEMHKEAEWGVAAHWHYELDKESKAISERLNWIGKLVEWQKDLETSAFMEGFKIDVFKDRIFVFTPKGEAADLSEGATPVDFAYLIHTEIGNKCVGSKVNGRIVSLSTSLKNGDMVEILTSKKVLGPSRDWLRYAKTPLAKQSIKKWFKGEDKEKNLILGKELLGDSLKKIGKSVEKIKQKDLEKYLKKSPYNDLSGVLVAIGSGDLSPKHVASSIYLSEDRIKIKKGLLGRIFPFLKATKPKVKVLGEKGLLVKSASCCKPKFPQKIVGFVTRSKGITVHRKDCSNIKSEDKKRIIGAEWSIEDIYEVSIYIEAENSQGLLRDLTQLFTDLKIEVKDINLKAGKVSKITAKLKLKKISQLKTVLEKVSNISEVNLVKRL